MQSLLNTSVSALGAFGVGMQVTADNIANINTPYFKAGRAYYETGPQGYGNRVGEISHDISPGPAIPALPPDTIDISPTAGALREGSNVSLEREAIQMVSLENAYSANAMVVRTTDDIMGVVLDMKV
ncbi:MAG: flagellar basal body protein [Deltaproteobacteria bacterium]|jgi:flagellar basal-body rod protein FlgC|nr:flagellar basal body protein [Deltaproteobacteria bacterium]